MLSRVRFHGLMPIDALRIYGREILELAVPHGARNVRVFGSVAGFRIGRARE